MASTVLSGSTHETMSLCHWGMVGMVPRLEVDIYRFIVSCMKGQRGRVERFTLSYVSVSLVGQQGQCMTVTPLL